MTTKIARDMHDEPMDTGDPVVNLGGMRHHGSTGLVLRIACFELHSENVLVLVKGQPVWTDMYDLEICNEGW